MQTRRWAISLSIFIAAMWMFGQAVVAEESEPVSSFELLSQKRQGIQYSKDPCKGDSFSLLFSFSEDLDVLPDMEIALVQFSEDFEEFLISSSSNDDVNEISLYFSRPKQIGNRQIRVDYVARGKADIDLPNQIEVVILDDDLMQVLDKHGRRCGPIDHADRQVTLINQNPRKSCFQ